MCAHKLADAWWMLFTCAKRLQLPMHAPMCAASCATLGSARLGSAWGSAVQCSADMTRSQIISSAGLSSPRLCEFGRGAGDVVQAHLEQCVRVVVRERALTTGRVRPAEHMEHCERLLHGVTEPADGQWSATALHGRVGAGRSNDRACVRACVATRAVQWWNHLGTAGALWGEPSG
jgi:hypothetical protein